MKRLVANTLGIILSAVALILILVGVAYHDYIESFAFTIAVILVLITLPVLFAIDHRRKIKRIEYLEEKLRANGISFHPED